MRVLLAVVAALLLSTACAAPSAKATPTPAPVSQAVAPTSTIAAPTSTAIPATLTPAPATPTVPAPTATPAALVVANTGGDGVYVRKTANGDKVKAWPDGTVLTTTGSDQQVSGKTWRNVKDPDGNVGWVPAEYAAAAPSGKVALQLEDNKVPTPTAPPTARGSTASSSDLTAWVSARGSQTRAAGNAMQRMGELCSQAGEAPTLMIDKTWRSEMATVLAEMHFTGALLQRANVSVPSNLEHVDAVIRKTGGDLIYVADEMTIGLDTMQSAHINNAVSRMAIINAEIRQATAEMNAITGAQ
jgi:uncharacterized protein YndB with AHSA1/START domain